MMPKGRSSYDNAQYKQFKELNPGTKDPRAAFDRDSLAKLLGVGLKASEIEKYKLSVEEHRRWMANQLTPHLLPKHFFSFHTSM